MISTPRSPVTSDDSGGSADADAAHQGAAKTSRFAHRGGRQMGDGVGVRLVEDAGRPLSAGWLSRVVGTTGLIRGVRFVGGRRVRWDAWYSSVEFAHPPAGAGGPVRYRVGL